MALFPGRAGDKSAEHVASFNEQRDPQANITGNLSVFTKLYAIGLTSPLRADTMRLAAFLR